MILEDKELNFDEVLEKNIDFDNFNEFLFDFIKENKTKSIRYFLDYKEKDDDLFTFEYQLQDQNNKIKHMTENKNQKNIFLSDLKDLNVYIKQYYKANKIKISNINTYIISKEKIEDKYSINQEELDISINKSEEISNSESDFENNFYEKSLKFQFNELELIEKFNNLIINHKKMVIHFKELCNLCVNILIINFKLKFTFLDFSNEKRKIIKEIILALNAFLRKSLNNHKNDLSDEIRNEFINMKKKGEFDFNKNCTFENNNNLWEIYENQNLIEEEEYDDFESDVENQHIFSRKLNYNNHKEMKIKYSDRLLGFFLYNTCLEDLSNFIM